MTRIKSLFAAFLLAATVAVVPIANAQVVHYIGAGSSAMFQGFGIAAYNDLGLGADGGGICVAGKITVVSPGGPSGEAINDTCTVTHWTVKTAGALAAAKDGRSGSIPLEFGNFWTVYVTDLTLSSPSCHPLTATTGCVDTDVWAYLSIDSTVGVRTFLAVPRAKLLINGAAQTTAGAKAIAAAFFADGHDDSTAGIPGDVYSALGGGTGTPITAGMTDIRPEDAKLATERILGSVPSPFGSDTVPTTANPFIYSFSLGYGPGPIGFPIKSAEPGSTAAATPVEFSLPGGTDPITGGSVSSSINVYPVGESPIIFITNRTNTSTGLGQLWPGSPACGSSLVPGCTSVAFAPDGSYQYRNLWDQHPYPAASGVVPNLNLPSSGYCAASGPNTAAPECHVVRRPLGALFAGNDCETDMPTFSWPLDPDLQGTRTVPPNGTAEPITLFLREPLSGTYNTTEYTEIKRYGGTSGNFNMTSGTNFQATAYISQESNVVIGQPTADPLNQQCPAKYTAGGTDPNEGFRIRGIGTGEVTNGATGSASGEGVLNTSDSIAYLFFSFGNVSKMSNKKTFGYLMIDGVDPLFAQYDGTGGEPGQPVNFLATGPTGWGELPACGGSGQPACTAVGIWGGAPGTSPTYPHLRDGTYPAWSELRLLCDPTDPQLATSRCTTANDAFGAEALVQNLQADIHFSNLGGVPDLLPFADGGVASFNPPYGDASFIRSHYNAFGPNDTDNALGQGGNGPPPPLGPGPWQRTMWSSTRQGGNQPSTGSPSDPAVYINFGTEACSIGSVPPIPASAGTPVNGPPTAECGGDAGGFILPVGNTTTQQLQ